MKKESRFKKGDKVQLTGTHLEVTFHVELYKCQRGVHEVIDIKWKNWAPQCTCAAKLCGGPPEHGYNCDVHFFSEEGYALILNINGEGRSFPEKWFEKI